MKIIVLGDAFVDRYWVGRAVGMSAEAPIPTVKLDYRKECPGGAANVRMNLTSLGVDGRFLFPPLSRAQNWPIKNRLLVGDTQLARWDEDDFCMPYQREDLLELLDADGIVVSDYCKGAISEEVIQVLKGVNIPLFVDTKGDPKVWVDSSAVLFPNLKEFREFEESYSWLPQVVLKQGDMGMGLMQFGRVILSRPAMAEKVVCVNGAGDTALAAFVVAYLSGGNLEYCLEWANAAAGVAVENPYTYAPTKEEVDAKWQKMNSST